MPQIAQLSETYASQIFWVLIFFGLIFFVIGKGMVPKVMDTVAQRDNQIAGDLAAAEAARKQADAEEASWRTKENANRAEAQALIAKAKADAALATEKKLAAANVEIDKTTTEAEARIDQARTSALAEIEDVASEAAQDIVRRLAGVEVAADAAKSAVKEALNHG